MANCKFCGKEIIWARDGRRSTPVNPSGELHKCEEMIQSRESLKKFTPENLTSDEIKKYEEAINFKVKK